MNKKTLQEIAQKTKYFTERYKKEKENGSSLSFSEWLIYTETSTRNNVSIARTEATLGLYRTEDEEKSDDPNPDIAVLGTETFPQTFPKLKELYALRDEQDALEKEQFKLLEQRAKAPQTKAKKASTLSAIPEENENEEEPEKKEKQPKAKGPDKALSATEKRLAEIKKRLYEIQKEKQPLNKEFSEYSEKKAAYDKTVLEEKHKKAKEEREEYQADLKAAETNGVISRLGLLGAAKAHLKNRTWKDYLFHPFRSIGENMRYSEMRTSFLADYDVDEKQLDAIVSTVAKGEQALENVKAIDKNGNVVKESAVPEKGKNLSVGAEEKEQLQTKLDDVFAPEKVQKAEKNPPSVDEPKLDGPHFQK